MLQDQPTSQPRNHQAASPGKGQEPYWPGRKAKRPVSVLDVCPQLITADTVRAAGHTTVNTGHLCIPTGLEDYVKKKYDNHNG